jgi:hypothetical protein
VTEKPVFVDLIREATRQTRRRYAPRIDEPEVKEESRLSRRSERWLQWKLETFTPWKLRSWRFKDWS